jgi:hypothetical protein
MHTTRTTWGCLLVQPLDACSLSCSLSITPCSRCNPRNIKLHPIPAWPVQGGPGDQGTTLTSSLKQPSVSAVLLHAALSYVSTPQVYVQIDQLLFQQQQGLLQLRSTLPPQQLLRCISTLAGLKYSQPVQLAGWLLAAAAPLTQPGTASKPPAATTAGAAASAAVGQAAADVDIGSYRQALQQLRVFELCGLVANLARSGVRPSNAWLLAFMQVGRVCIGGSGLCTRPSVCRCQ